MNSQSGFMFLRKSFALGPLIAFLLFAACPSTTVRAGIVLGIESVSSSAGAFDVFLTNTGPSAVHIDTTQFEITSSSAQVSLTGATIFTTDHPYIFAGNSLFGPNINTSTGQTLDASDLANAGDSTIAAGASVGLGHILFTVTGTLMAPVTISYTTDPNFTSLAESGVLVPITTFNSGTISPSIGSVPEPSTVLLVSMGLGLAGATRFIRRVRTP
jgi:hypothetical protein